MMRILDSVIMVEIDTEHLRLLLRSDSHRPGAGLSKKQVVIWEPLSQKLVDTM